MKLFPRRLPDPNVSRPPPFDAARASARFAIESNRFGLGDSRRKSSRRAMDCIGGSCDASSHAKRITSLERRSRLVRLLDRLGQRAKVPATGNREQRPRVQKPFGGRLWYVCTIAHLMIYPMALALGPATLIAGMVLFRSREGVFKEATPTKEVRPSNCSAERGIVSNCGYDRHQCWRTG